MNKYKIDYNHYGMNRPFVLYARLHWWQRWQHVESFATKEDARAAHALLVGLPEYL